MEQTVFVSKRSKNGVRLDSGLETTLNRGGIQIESVRGSSKMKRRAAGEGAHARKRGHAAPSGVSSESADAGNTAARAASDGAGCDAEPAAESEYERQRRHNIKRNKDLLDTLGIGSTLHAVTVLQVWTCSGL